MMAVHSVASMGTVVTVDVVGPEETRATSRDYARCALDWFARVTACCSRFEPTSELMRLCATSGAPVEVSQMLFEVVQFALAVAADTGGAFDPTVGLAMEDRGFNIEFRTR